MPPKKRSAGSNTTDDPQASKSNRSKDALIQGEEEELDQLSSEVEKLRAQKEKHAEVQAKKQKLAQLEAKKKKLADEETKKLAAAKIQRLEEVRNELLALQMSMITKKNQAMSNHL